MMSLTKLFCIIYAVLFTLTLILSIVVNTYEPVIGCTIAGILQISITAIVEHYVEDY